MQFLCRPMKTLKHWFEASAPAAAGALALLALTVGPAQAEKADRTKPMVVEADQPGTVDLQRQIVVFNGNVVIAQGTMTIRAERVEVREAPDGYRSASAAGTTARPASYRQKRDGADEFVEAVAERIEFDQRADTLRFIGHAQVRRLRGAQVIDEIAGSTIVWDNRAEVFSVQGGASSPSNPSGRVRAVLTPRSEAASAPASSGAPAPLKPSRTLGEPR
jgi:lipopolysaccharide export system protein LptA